MNDKFNDGFNECCFREGSLEDWNCGCSFGCPMCDIYAKCKVCKAPVRANDREYLKEVRDGKRSRKIKRVNHRDIRFGETYNYKGENVIVVARQKRKRKDKSEPKVEYVLSDGRVVFHRHLTWRREADNE